MCVSSKWNVVLSNCFSSLHECDVLYLASKSSTHVQCMAGVNAGCIYLWDGMSGNAV